MKNGNGEEKFEAWWNRGPSAEKMVKNTSLKAVVKCAYLEGWQEEIEDYCADNLELSDLLDEVFDERRNEKSYGA